MKSWIARLRTSVALDAGGQPAAWLRRRRSGPAEVYAAEQEMIALDAALKQTPPRAEPPAGLHRAIMGAVRRAERPAAERPGTVLVRWVAAPALGAVLLLGAVWAWHNLVRAPAADTQSLAAATSALQFGNQMVQTAPSAVVAPLSDELSRLNKDLDDTAQFLLASLP